MIINTGMRTDIPAFYHEWLINRIKEGFVLVLLCQYECGTCEREYDEARSKVTFPDREQSARGCNP